MDSKEKIVIIGANEFQNKLICKAKTLGYETHVFAWQCGDIGEKTADYFYPISIVEKEKILEICKKINPIAICSIASDLAVLTVDYVARELHLNANSEKSNLISTNKFEMRKALKRNGIKCPKFLKISNRYDEKLNLDSFKFPLIVKPVDRSGSRAITKVFSKDEVEKAVNNAICYSFEKSAIIEEFIEGSEYSCESISFHGEHHLLAITKKYTTGSPNYIEIGHIEPSGLDENTINKIRNIIFKALDALEIKNSASHAEFKLDKNGDVGIIEIGARMGGDCIGSDLVQLSTGNDFIRMVIDVAMNKKPTIVDRNIDKCAAIRFYMNENDLKITEHLNKHFDIVENNSADLMHFGQDVKDSSSRHGFFIVVGNDYEKIKEILFADKGE